LLRILVQLNCLFLPFDFSLHLDRFIHV